MSFLDPITRFLDRRFPNKQYTISNLWHDEARGISPPKRIADAITKGKTPPRDYRPKELKPSLDSLMLPPSSSGEYYFFGGTWHDINEPETKHVFFLGTTGSGKSLQMLITLGHLAKSIRRGTRRRMLIFASKDDALSALYGLHKRPTVLRLSDPDSPAWDIARDYDEIGKAQDLAALLIPQEDRGEVMWSNGARLITAGVIRSFIYNHGTDWRFDDLFWAIHAPKDLLLKILESSPGNGPAINAVLKTVSEKTVDGLRIQMATATAHLYTYAAHCQKARRFWSISDFLEKEEIVVIQPDLDAFQGIVPVMHAIFQRTGELLAAKSELDDNGKTWVFLDEAQFLGRIPGVVEFATYCRSKGGTLFLATQTVEGLLSSYGEKPAQSLFGVLTRKSLLKADTVESAKWCASQFGSVEHWEMQETEGISEARLSHSESGRYVVRQRLLDTDFLHLPPASPGEGVTGYFIPEKAENSYRLTIPADVISELLPPRGRVPVPRRKSRDEYILGPWIRAPKYSHGVSDRVLQEAMADAMADVIEELINEVARMGKRRSK